MLGNSTLRISKICLGTMNFGKSFEDVEKNLLSLEEASVIVKKALDLGINFFETSSYYNNTTSATYLAEALRRYVDRERVILAVKIFSEDAGLSRKEIFRQVNQALKILRTSYIDLVIIQGWDPKTPIEETMGALHDLMKIKQIKYIGASTMRAYQFLKAQEVARSKHWHTFVTMQSRYNLVYREAERELVELLKEESVSMIPYTPLASGKLAKLCESDKLEFDSEWFLHRGYDVSEISDCSIIMRVKELAEKYQVTMSQIALAWLLGKEQVAAPVVGATRPEHLEEIINSIHVKMSEEDVRYLEEFYIPHILLDVC